METTQFAAIGDGCLPSGMPASPERVRQEAGRARPKGYTLPHDVAERLGASLAGFRNAEAAMALAVFLARFWSARAKLARPFPVDRRALADRHDLGLTESRIRGALRVLEEVGFLHRGEPAPGSVHQATPDGLHRKPILFGFGPDYGPSFAAANDRAARARARREGRAVHGRALTSARQRVAVPENRSPKDKPLSGSVVIMGGVAKGSSREPGVGRDGPPSDVEAALSRLRNAFRRSRGGALGVA